MAFLFRFASAEAKKSINFTKDYYAVLKLKKNASTKEIKKSYYALAKECHPDINQGSDAKIKEIN
jgi:curved DNA-binding protein CbpA